MPIPRMIPCLLLKGEGFYKTTKFRDPSYLGDPINIVRIFNEKEVDELCILDITATTEGRRPNFSYLADLASECFMPLSYGGGITTIEDCKRLFGIGLEKIVMNSTLFSNPTILEQAAGQFGSQSVVASLDVRKTLLGGYQIWTRAGSVNTKRNVLEFAQELESRGAGEILLQAMDRDGTLSGYDEKLVSMVTDAVRIPVIACGGAASLADMVDLANKTNVSAVAAGALFVYYGPHRAVLINPPTYAQFKTALGR